MASFEIADTAFQRSARRAYELGRLEGAFARGVVASLLALPGFLLCHANPLAPLCAAGFALVVAAGWMAGRGWAEGARAGAIAGLAPCLLPAAIAAVGGNSCAAPFAGIPWTCALGGLAAGATLGWRCRSASGPAFWVSALVALGLASSLGCLAVGAMGFVGLLIGVVAGGAPAFAVRRALAS